MLQNLLKHFQAMFKKLLSHSFLYSVAPQLPKLLSLALMPILTKYLTDKDYGIYGVITAYIFFISVLKDLGFSVVFVNTFFVGHVFILH